MCVCVLYSFYCAVYVRILMTVYIQQPSIQPFSQPASHLASVGGWAFVSNLISSYYFRCKQRVLRFNCHKSKIGQKLWRKCKGTHAIIVSFVLINKSTQGMVYVCVFLATPFSWRFHYLANCHQNMRDFSTKFLFSLQYPKFNSRFFGIKIKYVNFNSLENLVEMSPESKQKWKSHFHEMDRTTTTHPSSQLCVFYVADDIVVWLSDSEP